MTINNSVVAIYKSHAEAEAAVKELQESGFDMKKLSIVGRDYHMDQHVIGYYNAGDRGASRRGADRVAAVMRVLI